MAKLHYEKDVDPSYLAGKTVAILGYGSQGRAQARNLKDSGVDVRVGVREGPSARQAREDGLLVVPLHAAADADVIQFLVPDGAQPSLYEEHVRPRLNRQTLMFSHGFNVHFGFLQAPPTCDVVMVAPKGPGRMVREQYEKGFGVPCLVAVHQDVSGRARQTALSYARAIGGARAGVLETTFREETETDLFGEQAVLCGGVTELVIAGFETLVKAGYQAEVAYFECLHELKLIVDLLYEGGISRMLDFVSDTAKFGGLTRGTRVVDDRARAAMRSLLREIQDGSFAREWVRDLEQGMPQLKKLSEEVRHHRIEEVGRRLRSLMRGEAP